MTAEPSALPRRDDVVVNKGAEAPKPCLSLLEMRSPRAAGGLLPAGTTFTATRTIFHQPLLWFCPTKEIYSRTSIKHSTTYSSFWKIEETKTRQTLVFDPWGSTSRPRACPFLGRWRALLCAEVFVWARDGSQGWSVFWLMDDLEYTFPREVEAIRYAVRVAGDRKFPEPRLVPGSRKRQTARGYGSCGDERM